LRYLKIFNTLVQSYKLLSVDFLKALLTANNISGRVQIAKYNKLPTALLYFVTLNFCDRKFEFITGIRFFEGVKSLMLNLLNISFIYLVWCKTYPLIVFVNFIPITNSTSPISFILNFCMDWFTLFISWFVPAIRMSSTYTERIQTISFLLFNFM